MKNDVMSTTSDYFGTCITLIKKKKNIRKYRWDNQNGQYRETFSFTILIDINQCTVYRRLLRLHALFEV